MSTMPAASRGRMEPRHMSGVFGQGYDLGSRHILVGRIVTALARADGPVLDIGGSEGLTKVALPDRRVVTLDIREVSTDIVASGTHLPFRDNSFAAALALDVLEHIPDSLRGPLIDEAARVADLVVLAGPYDDPRVIDAEAHQRSLFYAMFHEDHNWLIEHAECGLPSLATHRDRLGMAGLHTACFGSNPLALWEAQLLNSHIAVRVGIEPESLAIRKWLMDEFLDRADATPPSYRHILVASSRTAVAEALGAVAPGVDEPSVADAVRRTELATAAVIGSGFEDLRST